MGKLFFVAAAASALAFAAGAQTMPQPEPQAVVVPVKVEQVTAAAHLTYRDAEHNTLFESNLITVGEVPMAADGGCRMRDSAQDAAPSGPKTPTTEPRKPRADDMASVRPKGHWTVCS
ncbi:MAG TPA: hypothetical protein VFW13_14510 [Phenylobacterium sp.]|nr:hypothetical protein [Phenylobacterium sp.]